MNAPTDIASLLGALRSAAPTSPRLVWYGPGGERVELSGRVVENWVAKTSNLLVEELDAEPGTVLALELAPHWRSVVWALAAWQVGLAVAVPPAPEAAGAPITVTGTPEASAAAPGGVLVAVAPGALDMRWPGTLAPGVLDYAAEVRSFSDVFLPDADPADGAAALLGPDGPVTFGGLVTRNDDGGTVLVAASAPMTEVLRTVLAVWAAGGAVVLVDPRVEVTERLLAGERVTSRR